MRITHVSILLAALSLGGCALLTQSDEQPATTNLSDKDKAAIEQAAGQGPIAQTAISGKHASGSAGAETGASDITAAELSAGFVKLMSQGAFSGGKGGGVSYRTMRAPLHTRDGDIQLGPDGQPMFIDVSETVFGSSGDFNLNFGDWDASASNTTGGETSGTTQGGTQGQGGAGGAAAGGTGGAKDGTQTPSVDVKPPTPLPTPVE